MQTEKHEKEAATAGQGGSIAGWQGNREEQGGGPGRRSRGGGRGGEGERGTKHQKVRGSRRQRPTSQVKRRVLEVTPRRLGLWPRRIESPTGLTACCLDVCVLSRLTCGDRDSTRKVRQHPIQADWPGEALSFEGIGSS